MEAVVSFADGVYTLVTIETDEQAEQGDDHGHHGDRTEAEGAVTAMTATSITVQRSRGRPVMFAVPAGFNLHGVKVGSNVEAKGTVQNGVLTLTRLEVKGDDNGDDDDDDGPGDDHHGGDDGDHGGHHGGHDGH